ncbi:MAG: AgmX/PglI C-terminal domain-containing protein [Pseudomonadota bacterium]
MTLSYAHGMTLPWSGSADEEQRFRLIMAVALALALLFGITIPLLELPEKERFQRQTLPPRLAQLILEQKQKPPPPKPKELKIPEKKKTKPEKKPEVKKKPQPKPVKAAPKKVAKQPPKRSTEAARKKAASSGLLAFADDLADLRDDPGISSVQSVKQLSKSGNKAATSQRAIISSGVSQGSGGINTAKLSRDTGGQGLSGRQTTQVKSSAVRGNGGNGQSAARKAKNHKGNRTREEIQLIFDQNKGAVYALYNRALRKNPILRGKVVLELTIAPSGKVTGCKILSSELNDKKLERKLVSRVKLFKFSSKDVDVAVVSYPIDFLPS